MNLKNIFIPITLSVATAVLLTSCSGASKMVGEAPSRYAKISEKVDEHKSFDAFKGKINTKRLANQCIYLNTGSTVRRALDNLSDIDNNVYFLRSDNVDIPAIKTRRNSCAGTFKELNEILENTTNYTMRITANKYRKDKVKIVEVLDKKAVKSNLVHHSISLEGAKTVRETFKQIAKETHFNVVYSHGDSDATSSQGGAGAGVGIDPSQSQGAVDAIDWFDSKYVNFYGENVGDLLEYLSKSLNLFYEIDYRNKLIVISKYKTKYFRLNINNLKIKGNSSGGGDSGGEAGASGSSSGVENTIELDIYGELEQILQSINSSGATGAIGGGVSGGSVAKSFLAFDKITGNITVRAELSTMLDIEKVINNFNDSFSRRAVAILTVYEVLLERSSAYGLDIDYSYANVASTKSASLVTQLLSATPLKGSVTRGNSKLSLSGNSKQVSAVLLNVRPFKMELRNHIPYTRNNTITRDYIASQTITSNISNGVTQTESSQEIEETKDGYIFSVQPKLKENELSAYINFAYFNNLKLEEKQVSTSTFISLPTDVNDNFSSSTKIKKGEKVVIGSIKSYSYAKDYEGLVPIEDFIVGGKNSEKLVVRESIITLEYVEDNQQ